MKYQVHTRFRAGYPDPHITEEFDNVDQALDEYLEHKNSPNTIGGYIANRHGIYLAYGSHASAAKISYEEWEDA